MKAIQRNSYPELNKILWDTRSDIITPELAYKFYETRWQFVDQKKLTHQEKILIEKLTKLVGNGLFMPENH